MRIAHVFKDFYPPLPAGITRYIHDVASGTAAAGHAVEVHVAGVSHSRRDYLHDGIVVHRHREFGRLLSSPLAPGLVTGVSRADVDLLHLHMPNPIGEVGALLRRRTVHMIVSFHAQLGRQQFLEPAYGPLRRLIFRQSRSILVSSAAMAGAPELAGFSERVKVVPYGVSPKLFETLPPPVAPRQGPLRVLFVGRLVYYKGLQVLIRALALMPAVTLTVIGDGPLRSTLHDLSREIGVTSRVDFRGIASDIDLLAAYREHDLLVLPSVSGAEAFGLAMVEAMASGLPVISTRLGTGTDWVNLDGVTGLVVPPGDVSALTDALRRLDDDGRRVQMGDAARARAADQFSFQRHLDTLLATYADAERAGA